MGGNWVALVVVVVDMASVYERRRLGRKVCIKSKLTVASDSISVIMVVLSVDGGGPGRRRRSQWMQLNAVDGYV